MIQKLFLVKYQLQALLTIKIETGIATNKRQPKGIALCQSRIVNNNTSLRLKRLQPSFRYLLCLLYYVFFLCHINCCLIIYSKLLLLLSGAKIRNYFHIRKRGRARARFFAYFRQLLHISIHKQS